MSSTDRTLKQRLARFMDPHAFTDRVPDAVRHTCANIGRTQAAKLKRRREIAVKRADAAIRFFSKPGNSERLERSIEARGKA